jgi:D-cysteine desulfhydrase
MGGNKLRKLEYLAADALAQGADTLITAGAIQSNHVRQTAALAAKLGLGCVALLENPLGTDDANYLGNGNRLLLDLFDAKVELVENLDNADEQLHALAARLRSNGKNRIWCRSAAPTRSVPWVMCVPAWNWPNRSRTAA